MAYSFDIQRQPSSSTSVSSQQRKRASPVEFVMPDNKLFKTGLTNDGETDNMWWTPSKALSYIYPSLLASFKNKIHVNEKKIVRYKNNNAFIHVYTRDHSIHDDNFVFNIEIKQNETTSVIWKHVYAWSGSWFKTHLQLLCLFDLDTKLLN